MLIKDNEGDWGVCVAVWRGMKKGVPGVPGKYLKDAHELKRPANISYFTHNDCGLFFHNPCFFLFSKGSSEQNAGALFTRISGVK